MSTPRWTAEQIVHIELTLSLFFPASDSSGGSLIVGSQAQLVSALGHCGCSFIITPQCATEEIRALGALGLIDKRFKNGLERKLKVNLASLKENPESKQALNLCTCWKRKMQKTKRASWTLGSKPAWKSARGWASSHTARRKAFEKG